MRAIAALSRFPKQYSRLWRSVRDEMADLIEVLDSGET